MFVAGRKWLISTVIENSNSYLGEYFQPDIRYILNYIVQSYGFPSFEVTAFESPVNTGDINVLLLPV